MTGYVLTTIDNPFDPSLEFKEWNQFDTSHGYNSLSYLARVGNVSDEMSEADYEDEMQRAIDEIISIDPFGIYIKVPHQENDNPSGLKH
jgi:hypothetical protein